MLALAGFGVACVGGIASGHDAVWTLWRALAAMLFCYLVGLAIGRVASVAVLEHVEAHRAANPMPPAPKRPYERKQESARSSQSAKAA
ncbi:MAG: hypothetical protein R3B49_04595 [Phycisphaerales bacterium]